MEKFIDELIKEYEQKKENYSISNLHYTGLGMATLCKGFTRDLEKVKSSLPKPVEVPEFVAEYLEMRKDQAPVGGLGAALLCVFDGRETPKLFNWMNNNVEVFARAWLEGWKLTEAPLYYVDFINDSDVHKRLVLDHENDKYNIVDWSDNLIELVQDMFTESEIRKVNPDFMAFALPVKEDAE
ncbi:hypothetical protein UAY_01800 [Enterococcus moraviensis ATCC BAA-383]|uniref:DUF1642 domain-containing protein n=1 Tax=Enterococcus moraviensis ATCC BAA-383 TaxID=1158609 RepID=R2TKR7_9ENTE|nr:DUF1642 domain-containing protein [Enterococcus moraviensis]EOI00697.1 hypothetical protein UAY_01800 [Enterococcus moraviensis ATCC BAA-383]EOT73074.1 hypothetical protein I586_00067 [Enterococcus moraviensis ATCC BAA-383]OJG68633.1 hypothetical protein RV09_GL000032 [Enterococcus moraviensis]